MSWPDEDQRMFSTAHEFSNVIQKPQTVLDNFYINIPICMFDHDFDMDFHMTVMLRSTTGPYGRPMIEVAYGEMIYLTPPRLYGRG